MENAMTAQQTRLAVALSEAGKNHLKSRLAARLKPQYAKILPETFDAWLVDACDKLCDRIPGSHEPTFELAAWETRTGLTETIEFNDGDFIWETVEEEGDELTHRPNRGELLGLVAAWSIADVVATALKNS